MPDQDGDRLETVCTLYTFACLLFVRPSNIKCDMRYLLVTTHTHGDIIELPHWKTCTLCWYWANRGQSLYTSAHLVTKPPSSWTDVQFSNIIPLPSMLSMIPNLTGRGDSNQHVTSMSLSRYQRECDLSSFDGSERRAQNTVTQDVVFYGKLCRFMKILNFLSESPNLRLIIPMQVRHWLLERREY